MSNKEYPCDTDIPISAFKWPKVKCIVVYRAHGINGEHMEVHYCGVEEINTSTYSQFKFLKSKKEWEVFKLRVLK